MSLIPADDPNVEVEIVIQKTDLASAKQSDPPGIWHQFLDTLRRTIGLRPLYLAERWAEAKVRDKELENEARHLRAIAKFGRVTAATRKLERDGRVKAKQQLADAEVTRAKARLGRAKARQEEAKARLMELAIRQLEACSLSPDEAAEWLQKIIRQIEAHGGNVEFQLPESPEDNPQTDSH